MNYPEFLKKGDTIGICAPSGGIVKPEKIEELNLAKKQLQELGYKVVQTESVCKEYKGRSNTGEQRAKEFMQLLKNDDVKLIIFATGGDFLIEMLDYLDFDELKNMKPKWLQGFSDITSINFLFNTILEIPTMYCQTIKDYAMNPLYRNLTDALKIESGEEVLQYSFEKHEKVIPFTEQVEQNNPNKTYNLTENVEWKNITGESKIEIKGRTIGGCLDCIKTFFGTKYDYINKYIDKYKEDGIIWFLECFEMSTPELFRILWQMKNAGYFRFCNGIIFGRPLFVREDYDISFDEAIKEALKDIQIPIITGADIGHVAPQMALLSGAFLEIRSEKGKGIVKTYFK